MTTQSAIICMGCSRFHRPSPYQGNATCDAFPEEIPVDIILKSFDHRQPFEGDNGVTFDQEAGLEFLTLTYNRWIEKSPDAQV